METIYNHIKEAVLAANIPGIRWVDDYPKDFVVLEGDPIEDEEMDTLSPLVKALDVIKCAIENFGDQEDDLEVIFTHLPGEERWSIAIGDGR